MIMISYRNADNAAGLIPMKSITAVAYHTGSGGICTITHSGANGNSTTTRVNGQEGADLYNALVSLCAIVPTTGT
jgi:hypothetical protein